MATTPIAIEERPAERLITGEEFARMSDIELDELVEGRIIKGMPTGHEHGSIEANIASELRSHVRQQKLGRVMSGEVGIYTRRNPDHVRAADVLYMSNERYARVTSTSFLDVAPELVVEVLSPDDTWSKFNQKLREYFATGVLLIWVVDAELRTVSAYRSISDMREFTHDDVLTADDILPGFSVPVAQMFED